MMYGTIGFILGIGCGMVALVAFFFLNRVVVVVVMVVVVVGFGAPQNSPIQPASQLHTQSGLFPDGFPCSLQSSHVHTSNSHLVPT
jgi:hypothetical protein